MDIINETEKLIKEALPRKFNPAVGDIAVIEYKGKQYKCTVISIKTTSDNYFKVRGPIYGEYNKTLGVGIGNTSGYVVDIIKKKA